MWGTFWTAATSLVGGYFVALIVERVLGVMLTVAQNAPNSDSSAVVDAISTAQSNFYLLVILGIVIAFLARAVVEARLVSPS